MFLSIQRFFVLAIMGCALTIYALYSFLLKPFVYKGEKNDRHTKLITG